MSKNRDPLPISTRDPTKDNALPPAFSDDYCQHYGSTENHCHCGQ